MRKSAKKMSISNINEEESMLAASIARNIHLGASQQRYRSHRRIGKTSPQRNNQSGDDNDISAA